MPKSKSKTEGDKSTLGAIVAHPLRSRCLTRLAERTASPTELSEEFEENLGNVSYHVRKLWRAGVVEITDEQPVRGAMEHFYRAVVRPNLSDEEVAKLTIEERQSHALQGLALVAANATDSIDEKTFGKRSDYHISRVPLRVDEEGWQAIRDLYADTLERVLEIQVESTERLGASGEAGTPVVAFNTFFEMPERPRDE